MKLMKFTIIFVVSLVVCGFGQEQPGKETFLKNSRQLTYDGKRSGEAYFAPDGQGLIFQSERDPKNPFFQIYFLDLQTGDSHRISPGLGKTTCAFFRPGTDQVLFASTHLDPDAKAKQEQELEYRASGQKHRYTWDYDEQMDIFSARRDGSELRRLTSARGYDAEGSYSQDGRKVVFCSLRDIYLSPNRSSEDDKRLKMDPAFYGEIYMMKADGSEQTRLTDWPGYDGGPFFTPDGKRIVWRHFEENGALADIYTMRLDGSDIRRLTRFNAMSWAPYFHPLGDYVIFASNKLGFANFELYMVDARGEHEPVRVTFTDGFDGLPVFSPDGSRLCWTTNRTSDGNSQLFIAEWDHQAALAAIASSPRKATPSTNASGQKYTSKDVVAGNGKAASVSFSPEITTEDLHAHVEFLASDRLQGRMTGTEGTRLASEYIAAGFEKIGLKPAGTQDTFFQQFPFTSGMKVVPERNHLLVSKSGSDEMVEFEVEHDFRPLAFSSEGDIEGEVVFAGYGLSVPGDLAESYDSYAGLDVSDKIVLVLRYVPEAVGMKRRQTLNRYAGLRYKALIAREHGAKALLVVGGPNSPNAGELVPLSFDMVGENSGIVAASISAKVADLFFENAEKSLKQAQSELDDENPHAQGAFELPNVKVKLQTSVQRIKKTGRNVIGLLPATASTKTGEAIIIGAHYDHIGFGEIGSLAHKGEEGQIHNGADDNASGTSMVLELAAALSELQQAKPEDFKRDLVFALWSGEELGLIGSTFYAEHPSFPISKTMAYLNFDMVGRLRKNTLVIQGLGSSPVWTKMLEKRNVAAGFNLTLQEDPYLPTDATSFYTKEVPILAFFTGSHEDYNRPTDDPPTLSYGGMERIGKFAQSIVVDLLRAEHSPEYVKVERSTSQTGDRETLRAYLGTIPDYVSEGAGGVKLSGVRAGGPADKGGLKGGDVIIEFAGQNITNIYDYTYALDAIKIGEPVKVVVVRDGEKVTLMVTPEARK